MRRALWLAGLGAACALPAQTPLGLHASLPRPAPAGWERVQGVEVSGAPEGNGFSPPMVEGLAERLKARLSTNPQAVTLRADNVRAVVVAEAGLTPQTHLGVGADFALSDGARREVLKLEHSLSFASLTDDERDAVYGRLLDDLLEQLFYHPQALAFLGEGASPVVDDSALADPTLPVGPPMRVEASLADAQATGRVLWGSLDAQNHVALTAMVGDIYGVVAGLTQRNLRIMAGGEPGSGLGFGYGLRLSYGVGGLAIPMGGMDPTFMFDLALGLAGELGLANTALDAQGYVERPGVTVLFVPQLQLMNLVGSVSLPVVSGSAVTFAPTVAFMQLFTFGAALEADVPLGQHFGLTAGVLGGVSFGHFTAGGFSAALDLQPAFSPGVDLYIQTSTGRFSLGAALQTIAQTAASAGQAAATTTSSSRPAEGPGLFDNFQVTLTYQDRFGRGLGYQTTGIEVAGLGTSDSRVLSAPRSAFVEAHTSGAKTGVEPQRITLGTPAATVSGSADAAPADSAPESAPPAPAAPDLLGLWVVLPVVTGPGIEPNLGDLVRGIAAELLDRARCARIPPERVAWFFESTGVNALRLDDADLADVLGGLAAKHALAIRLATKGDVLQYHLTRVDAGQAPRVVQGEVRRLGLLRVAREAVEALLRSAADVASDAEAAP